MSSSSAAVLRTRSLRKPAPAASLPKDADASKQARPVDALRNVSPSRLPVKPPASAVTTRAASAAQAATSALATATATANPKTGFLGKLTSRTTRSTTAQQKAAKAEPTTTTARGGATSKPIREAGPVTRRAAAGPPLSHNNGVAIARPKTSGGVPSGATARSASAGHSRTKSSATTLTSTPILRPPSSSSSQTSTSTSTTTTAPSSRPPVTASPPKTLHRRAPSNPVTKLHTDPSKQQQPPLVHQAQQHSEKSSRTITPTSPPPPPPLQRPQNQRLHRPAFNTNQQHYSPVKSLAPKPLTSTYLAPPSPSKLPANVAISAETSRLQTELLQLHLLHREAAPASVRWHASARARLADRFTAVREAGDRADRAETAAAEDLNAAALKAWTTTGCGGETLLEERVQALDAVLCGLWAMGEPGGRYARVVRRFEKWADTLRAVVERREEEESVGLLAAADVPFVEALDPAWRDECAALARKLDGWRRQLVGLGAVHSQNQDDDDDQRLSSLAVVLAACRSLVHDMLAELDGMEQIEREALRQENEWIENMNRDDGNDDTPKAGAIWRVL